MEDKTTRCDAYGETLAKATLQGSGWTYYHDEINKQIHMIIQQPYMAMQLEIEDNFIKKLQGTAISTNFTLPILSKHLKCYVPYGRQLGIASNKFPAGIDQFAEVEIIHNGTIQCRRPNVRDKPQGSAAVDKFQGQDRRTYLANLRRKEQIHFGTVEGARGPIETIFRHMDFKPLAFGFFSEMSSGVRGLIAMAVEYDEGKHLGRNTVASSVDIVISSLRRRYKTQLSLAAWRRYANLLLDTTKYVATGHPTTNKAHIRLEMRDTGDTGAHGYPWMAHETDVLLEDAFPIG